MVLPAPFFESRIFSVADVRVHVRDGQVQRLGDAQPGAIKHPKQHRVDHRLVRIRGHRLGIDDSEQSAHLVVGEHIRHLMTGTDQGCRGRHVGLPAGGLGMSGQLAQHQLVAPQGARPQVTAVEEPVDRFFGDRPVRIALPAAVVGELAQHPFRDCEPVSAGVTHSDQLGDQAGQCHLRHHAHPPGPVR